MSISELIAQLNQGVTDFTQVITTIEAHYAFTPTEFKNGEQVNLADTNNGSCKIFAFAKLNDLSPQATLNAFGQYYAEDVLQNPNGEDHANIRNFMVTGWEGIEFKGQALKAL